MRKLLKIMFNSLSLKNLEVEKSSQKNIEFKTNRKISLPQKIFAVAIMDIKKGKDNLHYQANYKSKQQHKKNVLSMV